MIESDVQRKLMVTRYARTTVIPNYTPRGWWECDVFEITASRLAVEYEIKLTRSDFFADAKKDERDYEFVRGVGRVHKPSTTKHQLLARAECVPSRFFFVTALGIVTAQDIPPWAGWIEAENTGKHWSRICLLERRPAPRIHRVKVEPSLIDHIHYSCYWRYMRLFLDRQPSAAIDSRESIDRMQAESLTQQSPHSPYNAPGRFSAPTTLPHSQSPSAATATAQHHGTELRTKSLKPCSQDGII